MQRALFSVTAVCAMLVVEAQNASLGIKLCVGVCSEPKADGSIQLCGSCYDTDPYYTAPVFPETYTPGLYGYADGTHCGAAIPNTTTGIEEMLSATYADAFAKDAGTTVPQGEGCGECQLMSLHEMWIPDQMINPPAEYRAGRTDCVRNTEGIATDACKRLYTYTRQCNQDLRVVLVVGPTPAPTAAPTAPVDTKTEKKESSSPLPIILGATALIVAAGLFFGARLYYRKKRSAGGDPAQAKVETKNPGADAGTDL
jgi:hypothetical protein